jgi:multidrug efflux system membrane fusion protein
MQQFSTHSQSATGRCGLILRFIRSALAVASLPAAGLLVSACGKPPAMSMNQPPAPVKVTIAVSQDTPVYLDEIGKVTALEVVTITPQVAGQIKQRLFKDGDEVKANQPLFTVNPDPFDAALAQAQAVLKKDRATADNATTNAERQRQLLATKATSPQNYDDARFAADAAVAAVAGDEAAVSNAKINRDWCDIKSPIDGRAGQRLVDTGNVVKANEGSLLVIEALDKVYADFTVNEQDLALVRKYMANNTLKTLVWLPTDPDGPRSGHEGDLTFLDNSVQDSTGTIKLRALIDNKDRHFWPGQFVNVRLVLYTAEQAVLVPLEAPQLSQKGSYVFVIGDQSLAQMRPITLGQKQGDMVVVQTGLRAGETVVTDGQMTLFPNAPVKITNPASPQTRPVSPAAAAPKLPSGQETARNDGGAQ